MNTPFHIAKHLGVIVISESLGEIAGYYHKIEDQKIIHVDESQSEWEKSFVVGSFLNCALWDSNEFQIVLKHELIEQPEQSRTG